MGKFTLHDEPIVDQTIEHDLATIRKSLLSHMHPDAILLSGSFGRGEGSVYLSDGKIQFFSDYEIDVISRWWSERVLMDRCNKEIRDKIKTTVSLSWMTKPRLVSNRIRNLTFGPIKPTISMYELKLGSKILYGNIDLTINTIDPATIPICDAVRLIENRMIDLLIDWSRSTPRGKLAFNAAKLALACGDALLLDRGLYHYSYKERERRFTTYYESEMEAVFGDKFLPAYRKAISYKLLPFLEFDANDVLEDLDIIYLACKAALIYFLKVDFTQIEYPDFVQFFVRAKLFPVSYQSGLAFLPDRIFENSISAIRCWRSGKKIYWNLIPPAGKELSILQLLYITIPMLFFGSSIVGSPNERLLNQALINSGWMLGPQSLPLERLENVLIQNVWETWRAIS